MIESEVVHLDHTWTARPSLLLPHSEGHSMYVESLQVVSILKRLEA